MRRSHKPYALIALLALNPSVDSWGDYEAGVAAYERGDYAAAAEEMKVLADRNDPRAQTFLGNLYADGAGVPQNWQIAVHLYKKAATQGHEPAEQILESLGIVGVYSSPSENARSTSSKSQIFHVQLAAFRSSKRAHRISRRLKDRFPGLFNRLQLRVVRADLGEELGIWYRIRAGPLPDRASANQLCIEIRRRNAVEECYLVSESID